MAGDLCDILRSFVFQVSNAMVAFSATTLGLVVLAALCSNLLVVVDATQAMRRPPTYKVAPKKVSTESHPKIHEIYKRSSGYVNIGYFPNWSIYTGLNYQPTQIIASQYTHILYSFADTSSDTGAIILTDPYADEQKHFDGDSWSELGNNLYGCLKQMYLLKLQNRNLKVLLSIGGWTYSLNGHFRFVTNPTARAKFISDAVTLVKDYGFDGIDIDFEYPSSSEEGIGFANLLTELRTALNKLASSNGDNIPYQISAAVSAGSPNYAHLLVPQMDDALDFWNLMAYDYAGSWLTYSDNHANLYGGDRTGVSTDAAVKYFIGAGATAKKITMGIPAYGRGFANTDGLGQSFSGVTGDIDTGVYSYKNLPLAGSQVYENKTDGSSYSYDASKKEFVSYDTPNIVKMKTEYIKSKGLGGSMYWQIALDKVGSGSLVDTSNAILGSLDTTQNHIKYPNSKWDNIKNNMDPSPGTTTTTSGGSTPTGGCGGVAAWSSTAVYTEGMQASYNAHVWTAKWWSQGEIPGSADAWSDSGAC